MLAFEHDHPVGRAGLAGPERLDPGSTIDDAGDVPGQITPTRFEQGSPAFPARFTPPDDDVSSGGSIREGHSLVGAARSRR